MKKVEKVGFLIKIPSIMGTEGNYLNLLKTVNYSQQHHMIGWKIKATTIKINDKAAIFTFIIIQWFLKLLTNVIRLFHNLTSGVSIENEDKLFAEVWLYTYKMQDSLKKQLEQLEISAQLMNTRYICPNP